MGAGQGDLEWRARRSSSDDSLLRAAAEISEPEQTLRLSALLPGEVVNDRFVVEGLATSGGMGAIYRAFDLHTQKIVAIKITASASSAAAQRFAEEAAVLAELSHDSIVSYLAHGTTPQGTLFLAMEWLEGEDLAARLSRSALSLADSLAIIRRACEGLAQVHAREIIHRDIKPSNLFLVDRDPAQLKVLDFGVARQRQNARPLTQSGALLGTVGYMSPEQAMGPRDVDARADVFALGCVLFECLTGQPAFIGDTPVAVLAKVLHEQPARVDILRPELGLALGTLVSTLLAKNPDQRPADAAAVLVALERCSGAHSVSPRAAGRSTGSRISFGLALVIVLLACFVAARRTRTAVHPAPAKAANVKPVIAGGPSTARVETPLVIANLPPTASALPPKARALPHGSRVSPLARPAAVSTRTSDSPSAPPQRPAETGGLIQQLPF